MNPRDLTGKRREFIASERLLDFCGNPLPYFDPYLLGRLVSTLPRWKCRSWRTLRRGFESHPIRLSWIFDWVYVVTVAAEAQFISVKKSVVKEIVKDRDLATKLWSLRECGILPTLRE